MLLLPPLHLLLPWWRLWPAVACCHTHAAGCSCSSQLRKVQVCRQRVGGTRLRYEARPRRRRCEPVPAPPHHVCAIRGKVAEEQAHRHHTIAPAKQRRSGGVADGRWPGGGGGNWAGSMRTPGGGRQTAAAAEPRPASPVPCRPACLRYCGTRLLSSPSSAACRYSCSEHGKGSVLRVRGRHQGGLGLLAEPNRTL